MSGWGGTSVDQLGAFWKLKIFCVVARKSGWVIEISSGSMEGVSLTTISGHTLSFPQESASGAHAHDGMINTHMVNTVPRSPAAFRIKPSCSPTSKYGSVTLLQ